jgi:hypothetical protein
MFRPIPSSGSGRSRSRLPEGFVAASELEGGATISGAVSVLRFCVFAFCVFAFLFHFSNVLKMEREKKKKKMK